ncbi:GNAT family N-acetyltransferase [Caenimonas terrae]|uniref:GNAT family N-acetyltransferase n=1 Tax=Caenimonas terrae TaxID=696074 RepID=A0ABW0NF24_9BURK
MEPVSLRLGRRSDALTVAALSVQVFLDTYATAGVRPDLAREAFREYSEQAFVERLSMSGCRFVLAEAQDALLGFAEVQCESRKAPGAAPRGFELVRLYVQPQAQRAGVGSALLREAEKIASSAHSPAIWLTVWEENVRALAFYARSGYADVGATDYMFEGKAYGNRVVAKQLSVA